MMNEAWRPTASAAVKPKILSAARFHCRTLNSLSHSMTASGVCWMWWDKRCSLRRRASSAPLRQIDRATCDETYSNIRSSAGP